MRRFVISFFILVMLLPALLLLLMNTPARYIMIGGFLGAGKTTAVSKLAAQVCIVGVLCVFIVWKIIHGAAHNSLLAFCLCAKLKNSIEWRLTDKGSMFISRTRFPVTD